MATVGGAAHLRLERLGRRYGKAAMEKVVKILEDQGEANKKRGGTDVQLDGRTPQCVTVLHPPYGRDVLVFRWCIGVAGGTDMLFLWWCQG